MKKAIKFYSQTQRKTGKKEKDSFWLGKLILKY